MPTQKERIWLEGFDVGYDRGYFAGQVKAGVTDPRKIAKVKRPKPKRKLSAWNKFVKANSRKKEFRYRDGKLNLKKMGVAFRRKKRR